MKKSSVIIAVFLTGVQLQAQVEPAAGTWKTWFITSGKDYRLPAPLSYENEIAEVLATQKNSDAAAKQQIKYWNAGAPGYRWQEMMNKLWAVDTGRYAILANMLLGTAIYDATIAAWDTKYAYKRPRPFTADSRIKVYAVKPESPSYPCEHSVAAGVAVAIFSRFFPKLADSVTRMAQQLMDSRVAAGVAFPSDTRAGFDLGKRIAEIEIEHTQNYVTTAQWDGKVPDKPGLWRGKFAMFAMAGQNKTVVLESGSEFRPGPPPDFAKEMDEMKNYKQNFRSLSNAFYWANQSWFMENLPKKMFEQNLHLNPPRAARINAVVNVASYDAFIACWDAKYTYWGIRPSQYDTTYRPAILMTPPFPGYPSGHAAISGTMAEIYSYFFADEKELFHQKAKEAAESRFQAGIHFRSDNDVALELGKKVAVKVLERVKNDGADGNWTITNQRKNVAKTDN
ncbi:MAG TPA: vanadium-dependent haloperoxidase [Chitinophagaceae bacterium]|nr:vanadium-dependent haloperoxidase [Chitinophagaceae bacterium]